MTRALTANPRRSLASLAIALLAILAPGAPAQPIDKSAALGEIEEPRQHATARLIASHDAITPGEPMLLGVFLDIEEGWHTYWNGKNDSGFPISVSLDLPEGFKAEPINWPAPRRKVMPGDILDHVYAREVTLVIPITTPATLEPGERLRISADVQWLACDKDACIPEGEQVELELPVASPSEQRRPSREARLIKMAHARIPKPLTPETTGVSAEWQGDALIIQAEKASEILFYSKSECPDLIDPIHGATTNGNQLRLRFAPDDEQTTVRGVIEVVLPNHRYPRLYELEIPRPG